MIRLVLLVAAIAIFGTSFITVIINQLTSAKNIIMDLYNSALILSKTLDEIKKIINMTIWKLILCKIMILL
ncbi:hypothetical protein [Spiroplasma endosymbiont of Sarcophaga variegata]|uniref:hypothetical protein n=1 Tax=Spiroplasma endosymbiont of Sarcophaga variegata TaxID=3066304 RepID=UPI003AF8A7F2